MTDQDSANEKPAKVLIVDDNERNISVLENFCQQIDYETITANNGQEAIEKVESEKPDIILMDVMMPVMDGFQATEKLKGDEKTKFIPVIIVTALDSKDDKIRGISVGADDILNKPVDLWELALRMRNCLRIKKYQDQLKAQIELLEKERAGRR